MVLGALHPHVMGHSVNSAYMPSMRGRVKMPCMPLLSRSDVVVNKRHSAKKVRSSAFAFYVQSVQCLQCLPYLEPLEIILITVISVVGLYLPISWPYCTRAPDAFRRVSF